MKTLLLLFITSLGIAQYCWAQEVIEVKVKQTKNIFPEVYIYEGDSTNNILIPNPYYINNFWENHQKNNAIRDSIQKNPTVWKLYYDTNRFDIQYFIFAALNNNAHWNLHLKDPFSARLFRVLSFAIVQVKDSSHTEEINDILGNELPAIITNSREPITFKIYNLIYEDAKRQPHLLATEPTIQTIRQP
jgi:hypothetical protein